MQIKDLKPEIVKQETELNLYVQKAEDFSKSLSEIKEVTEENYETAKKLRADITSAKTSVEATRKFIKDPVLRLGEAIDARAKELSKPFEDMQDEIKNKIYKYEEEDRKKKKEEQKRIDDIIEKIKGFSTLKDLVDFYKTLNPKNQKKKAIAEILTIRKTQIIEEKKQKEIDDIIKTINETQTLDFLEQTKGFIDEGEHKNNVAVIQAYNDKKSRLEFEIEQEKLRKEREQLEKEKKEREEKEEKDRKEREEKGRIEKEKLEEEKRKILKDKIEIAVGKINLFITVEALDSFYEELEEDVKIADIVKSDYNSKRKSLLQALEIEKKEKEEKEIKQNEPAPAPVPIVDMEPGFNEKGELDEVSVKENPNLVYEQEISGIEYVLQKGFEQDSCEAQLEACIEAIKRTENITENRSEFLIFLRDFILDYNKD